MATAQCCNDVTKFKLPCILACRTNCLVQIKTAISLFQPTLLSNLAWHGFVKWSLAEHLLGNAKNCPFLEAQTWL